VGIVCHTTRFAACACVPFVQLVLGLNAGPFAHPFTCAMLGTIVSVGHVTECFSLGCLCIVRVTISACGGILFEEGTLFGGSGRDSLRSYLPVGSEDTVTLVSEAGAFASKFFVLKNCSSLDSVSDSCASADCFDESDRMRAVICPRAAATLDASYVDIRRLAAPPICGARIASARADVFVRSSPGLSLLCRSLNVRLHTS